jgi:hypothetical protein
LKFPSKNFETVAELAPKKPQTTATTRASRAAGSDSKTQKPEIISVRAKKAAMDLTEFMPTATFNAEFHE